MKVTYKDDATKEALEAAEWYEEEGVELRLNFLRRWKEAENRMREAPEINRVFKDGLRGSRFDIFPYALIYRMKSEDHLEVIAVMHSSRKPGYWKRRLKD